MSVAAGFLEGGLYPFESGVGEPIVAGVTLLVFVLLAGTGDLTGRAGAVGLAAVSVFWLAVNQSMEGPVILALTWTHGITTADLLTVGGLALAVWRWIRAGRRTRRRAHWGHGEDDEPTARPARRRRW